MENTLTNSLFRFVTFRGPELKPIGDAPMSFISHPNLAGSAIYQAVIEGDTLAEATAGYDKLSDGGLKEMSPALYDFAHWLAKNAQTVTLEAISAHTGITTLSSGNLLYVWENLFYQIAAQEDLHTKDRLIEMIIADRLLKNKATDTVYTDAQYQEMAKAKTVVPKELFGTNLTMLPNENGASDTPFTASRQMTQSLDMLIAKDKIAQYNKAADELKKAQQSYGKTERAIYQTALQTHKEAVQAFIAEQMEDWHPTDEYRDSLPYTEDDLPVFSYTPAAEMASELLESILSPESLFALEDTGLSDSHSFTEALDTLAKSASDATARIFDGSSFSKDSVIAAGVQIPVKNNSIGKRIPYSYTAKAYKVADGL